MNDKQQIEKMAKVIETANENCIIYEDGSRPWKEHIAQVLYNLGYRKLPKDSIVLSREEYDEIKIIKEMFATQVIESEKLKKSIVEAVNSFVRLETLYKIKCKELEIANKKLEGLTNGKVD